MKKDGNLRFRAVISMILLISGAVSIVFLKQYIVGILLLIGSMIFMSALYTAVKNLEETTQNIKTKKTRK